MAKPDPAATFIKAAEVLAQRIRVMHDTLLRIDVLVNCAGYDRDIILAIKAETSAALSKVPLTLSEQTS